MMRSWMYAAIGLALSGQAAPPKIESARVSSVLNAGKLSGTVLIAQGDRIVYERAFGTLDPVGGAPHRLGQLWRYGSVTKQWTATLAMQEVAAGRLDLDLPISHYLSGSKAPYAGKITARMLMQHVSGLPRTEESPAGSDDWPTFYLVPPGDPRTGVSFCEGPTDRAPPAAFRYGDCDFILMGTILEKITGKPLATLIEERFTRRLKLTSVALFPRSRATVVGYEGTKRESTRFRLENFGAAGALYGTTHDLLRFDRALMTGKLIPEAQRSVMWTGNPKLGFAALGQ